MRNKYVNIVVEEVHLLYNYIIFKKKKEEEESRKLKDRDLCKIERNMCVCVFIEIDRIRYICIYYEEIKHANKNAVLLLLLELYIHSFNF